MTKLGNRLLSLLLKTEKAGACVPEQGNRCCKYAYGRCESGRYYKYYRYGTINCYGTCVINTTTTCNKVGSGEAC